MRGRVRTRLARKESKRLMKQSVLLVVLTLGVILLLIFAGVPLLVRVAGILGDLKSSSEPIGSNDQIPPLAPQFSIPFEATPSATISITGYAEPKSKVQLFNSGNQLDQQTTSDEGTFNFENITLTAGENQFSAKAIDTAGNESQVSQTFLVTKDNTPPEISITEPSDGTEFYGPTEQVITIKGTTEAEASVFINGRFTRVDGEGNFTQSYSLSSGDNQIQAEARDQAGNVQTTTVLVKFTN